MKGYIGVYLHGFLSSAKSEKGQWLLQKNSTDKSRLFDEFITVNYPNKLVTDSVQVIDDEIKKQLKKDKKIVLLGSSLGGFYAQYFAQIYHLPYIMINPALNSLPVFKANMGLHTNPSTGEQVCIDEDYINNLKKYDVNNPDENIPALLLIDLDDEVIDVDFVIQRYQKRDSDHCFKAKIYSGGDHRFIHMEEAWYEIKEFVTDL
ncbi:esterase YqiA [Thiomicrorhabdus hydrogeniphila]